jgi:hypothetical protein
MAGKRIGISGPSKRRGLFSMGLNIAEGENFNEF